jgi:hypothetical protein
MVHVLEIFWPFSGINIHYLKPRWCILKVFCNFWVLTNFTRVFIMQRFVFMSYVYLCCVIRGIHIIFEIVKMMHIFCIHFCFSFLYICAVYFIYCRYGLISSKSRQHTHTHTHIYIYITLGNSIQNKLYIILTTWEIMWYALNNTTKRHIKHNEQTMLHYNDICKICEISEITNTFNACPAWFWIM